MKGVFIGIARTARLFECAQIEYAGDERPEVRDISDNDGSRCLASVPIEIDQGTVGSGEICNPVENSAEDLLCIRTCMLSKGDGEAGNAEGGTENMGDRVVAVAVSNIPRGGHPGVELTTSTPRLKTATSTIFLQSDQ